MTKRIFINVPAAIRDESTGETQRVVARLPLEIVIAQMPPRG